MTIGNRIIKLRKDLQLSQEDLAAKIGVTRQSVSKWETDACAPDAYNLMALAEVLQTSVEYIVTGTATPTKEPEHQTSKQEKDVNKWALLSVGLMLMIGGFIMAFIGMFLDLVWCLIGGAVAVVGIILTLVKNKKTLLIVLSVFVVLAVVVVLLLTV